MPKKFLHGIFILDMGLGQKLEEARNRKGISIREATESTKIRSDYLASFEAGNFDINLPDVYLRGFVRLYSRFLGLDQDAIVSDLALELGTAKDMKKSLGSISSSDFNENSEVKKSTGKIKNRAYSKSLLPKLILIFSVVAVLVLIISISYSVLSNPTDLSSEGTMVESVQIQEKLILPTSEETNPPVGVANELKLAAIGPIDRLIVCDEGLSPKKYFEYTSVPLGWESIPFNGSFRCYSSTLENLRFAVDNGPEKKAEGSGSGNFSWSK